MQISVIANPTANHQQAAGKALVKGFRANGAEATLMQSRQPIQTKHVACWGWRQGIRLKNQGHEVLVVERGYIGDRFEWYSLGWNGLNNRGRFPDVSDPSRFNTHFADFLKPAAFGGDYVLLVGQVRGDMSLQGKDLSQWYAETARDAAAYYGLPVKFRRHPVADGRGNRETVAGTDLIEGSLQDAIAGAYVVITFNSNTGVESVLAGRSTLTFDRGAMAWDVTGHAMGEHYHDSGREEWAHRLAWKQWRLEEIESGYALSHVMEAACST